MEREQIKGELQKLSASTQEGDETILPSTLLEIIKMAEESDTQNKTLQEKIDEAINLSKKQSSKTNKILWCVFTALFIMLFISIILQTF